MPAYADSCTNAYANPSATPAFVTFTARDAAGEVLARVVRTLLPGGHDAHGMMSLFGLTSFTGSIEVTSTEPIVSLSLNFEAAPVFSSLASGGTGCFRAVIDLFKPSFRCKHHRRYQGCFTPLASLARSCRIAVGLLFALVPLSAILFVLSILVASVGPVLRAQLSGEETIVRVFFDDLPTGRLIAASLEPIESKYENGYLVVEVTAEQLQRLQQRGLRTEPVSAQELSTILAPPREIQSAQAPEQAAAATRTGISGFSCYRTVEETFAAERFYRCAQPNLGELG